MGAPVGNKNAATSKKPWADALSRALEAHKPVEQRRRLDALAASLVAEAMNGSIPALKEIGDRLDGKAVQGVDIGLQDDNPIMALLSGMKAKALPVKDD